MVIYKVVSKVKVCSASTSTYKSEGFRIGSSSIASTRISLHSSGGRDGTVISLPERRPKFVEGMNQNGMTQDIVRIADLISFYY